MEYRGGAVIIHEQVTAEDSDPRDPGTSPLACSGRPTRTASCSCGEAAFARPACRSSSGRCCALTVRCSCPLRSRSADEATIRLPLVALERRLTNLAPGLGEFPTGSGGALWRAEIEDRGGAQVHWLVAGRFGLGARGKTLALTRADFNEVAREGRNLSVAATVARLGRDGRHRSQITLADRLPQEAHAQARGGRRPGARRRSRGRPIRLAKLKAPTVDGPGGRCVGAGQAASTR